MDRKAVARRKGTAFDGVDWANPPMKPANIFDNIPADLPEELFTTLLQTNNFRVEKIVSQGHASPSDFWYDQDDNEWLIVLQGNASIQFEGDAEPV